MLGKSVEARFLAKGDDAVGGKGASARAAVQRIGRDALRCLRRLHEAGFVHNDVKPMNILFGAAGSCREDKVHLIDFGMATKVGESLGAAGEGLSAGGGTPLFANLNQLDGVPTRPIDDVESLWYCLAYLEAGTLPWQWEPTDRVANIKRRMFSEECAVLSDECDAKLADADLCSTEHCLKNYHDWDLSRELHDLWAYVVAAHDDSAGSVDYDGCLQTLGSVPTPIAVTKGLVGSLK